MLELSDVHVHYGKLHILRGVSFAVGSGESVALLGRNGVGKTTTLRAIMGLARRTRGAVKFDCVDISRLKAWEEQGAPEILFLLGGADGLAPDLRNQANFVLSLGQMTWPHLLARAMLVEQIYRAQQILAGHPYHRD